LEKCGCFTTTVDEVIVYCPLHKAAPEMLTALKVAVDIIEGTPDRSPFVAVEEWKAIIAKAEPQEQKPTR